MKRVACLAICVALVGCDKGSEKPLTVKEINMNAVGSPNLAVDSAGGVNYPQLDLTVVKSQIEMKKDYDDYVMAMREAARASGASAAPKKVVPAAAGNGTGGDPSIPVPPAGDATAPASAPAGAAEPVPGPPL